MAYNVINVSKYVTVTNYSAAAATIDGVLIRAGYRGYGSSGTLVTDSSFETHYNGFLGKTKVGIYWTTQAITTAEAVEEAEYVYSLIKSKQIDFPVYLNADYGNSSHTGRADSLTKSERTDNAMAFCAKMVELGFRGGVYTSDSWFNYQIDPTQLQAKGYSIWVYKYDTERPLYVTGYDGWEYSESGSISGISGNCNTSYFYNDVAGWVTTRPDINDYNLVVPTISFEYTGEAIKCPFTLGSLAAGIDYLYTYSNNINAGTATCNITGVNNYQGTRSFDFTITPLPIDDYTLELNGYSFTYQGTAIEPTGYIVGLDSSNYEITYDDNIDAGTAKAIANGIGNYGGSTSRIFTITQRPLQLYSISIPHEAYKYTGEEIKPEVTIEGLTEDEDFTVEYSNNINIGIATITAKGINNYTGNITSNFRISANAISILTETVTLSYTTTVYNRSRQCPDITVGSLTEGTDYEVEVSDNLNVGIATIKITGINDYTDTIYRTFTITVKSIEDYTIELPTKEFPYTGRAIEPEFTVGELTNGVDFNTVYSNNINVGTGFITVTAKGNYIGSLNATFSIVKSDMGSDVEITLSDYTYIYDGTYKAPLVYVSGLTYGTDYTLKYQNNINAGTASVIVTGVGNYKGFKEVNYVITPQSIYDKELIIESTDYYYDINPVTPNAYIVGLRNGSDYVLSYKDNTAVGTAQVIATGINNYQGEISQEFRIHTKKISDCIAKYGYTSVKTIYRIMDDKGLQIYTDKTEKSKLTEYFDYEITNQTSKDMIEFTLVTFTVKGFGGFSDQAEFRFRMIDAEPSAPIDHEDDGVYNFGDIDLDDMTAYGNYDFKELTDPVDIVLLSSDDTDEDVPDIVKDGEDYDFDAMSGMYLDKYDEDDGSNIDEEGDDKDDPIVVIDNDDGKYNFGSLELQDETAVGDYDFGDLDEGVSEESVANGDYDFNKLAEDTEEGFPAGTEFDLNNTPIYVTYSTPASFDIRSGTYFVYNSAVVNGRIRMARTDGAVAMPGRSAGWCSTKDLSNLGAIVVGDLVEVDGDLFVYANGTGGTIKNHADTMYVAEILDDTQYEYPYALSTDARSAKIGFAAKDMITKVEEDE